MISGSSRVLAVLGDPVSHSLSPEMHNAAITALGLDAVYVALHVPPTPLAQILGALEAMEISGNITLPHKVRAAGMLIRLTPTAKEVSAVNTFWPEDGRLVGDNTDVAGLVDVTTEMGCEGPWLLAGTGGSARAVVAASRQLDVEVLVASRSVQRAEELVTWAGSIGARARVDDGSPAATLINSTPLGLNPEDPEPFPSSRHAEAGCALDLVYAPGGTNWIRSCMARGMVASDGRSMLVAQGARSFERFFPGTTAPREIMRAAVEHRLRG